jgi:predicted AlkP superfamily pyrophosphatase or phosphodiesterase
MATGMYPSHHGIVNNTFFDPASRQSYRISDRKAVTDGSWYGGEPIWVLAENHHLLSASFFWVGSEAAVKGVRPTYFYWFNDRIPLDARLKQVKDWLTLPADKRPHLILFYLSQVDHAEHIYGPASRETEEAVHVVDDCIGRMTKMVDSLGLPVNFIFVSDHGMAQVDTLHPVDLPRIDTSKFFVSGGDIVKLLYARNPNYIGAAYEELKQAADGFDVYLPDNTPERWHYRKKDDLKSRAGDIILVANYPRMFRPRGRPLMGEHGYDNAIPQMGASFYAWGPAFKEHLKIEPFENVNVYPLIAHILGLPVDFAIDGKISVLQPALK